MNQKHWIWMPHAGHFILGHHCQFHLATFVGGHIVSTVGEYWPEESVREIFAKSRGVMLAGRGDARAADYAARIGFAEIGCDRKYETMVFPAGKSDNLCCPYMAAEFTELAMRGYNDPADAYEGHLALCEQWSRPDEVEADQPIAIQASGESK